MYIILEDLVLVAGILVLAVFSFAVSVVALICQEAGKRLAVNGHQLGKHAVDAIAEITPTPEN